MYSGYLKLVLVIAICTVSLSSTAQEKHVPTIEEAFSLKTINSLALAPSGAQIAYTKQELDFDEDQYLTQLWLYNTQSEQHRQLTFSAKSVSDMQWSSDNKWIVFKRDGKLMAIRPDGGEPKDIGIDHKGIGDYALSQDMTSLVFLSSEDRKEELENRKETYGDFVVVNKEAADTHLFHVALNSDLTAVSEPEQITDADNFSIFDMALSPSDSIVAVAAAPSPRLTDLGNIDIYLVNLKNKEVSLLNEGYGFESNLTFSKDGNTLAFNRSTGFQKNAQIFTVATSGEQAQLLSESFDEDANIIEWNDEGIFFEASQKTNRYLYKLNPSSGNISKVSRGDELIAFNFSLSEDGKTIAYRASSDKTLSEIFTQKGRRVSQVTNMSEQIQSYALGKRELIQWKATDGAEIEAVLIKPHDYDASKKYPLYVVTHGGPTATDRPDLSRLGRWYPLDTWAGNGAMVLLTNYRGSAGYGEAFRSLNWRNLGIGPATDIISGVEHLDSLGMIDTSKVGCLGWSQGGHISAMLATYSDICVAANMGAGISNWETYYYNTDITQFTVEYFGKTPYEDKAVYEKTSPMTYLSNAKTPVLIQHGENDQRVPLANAYELRQGLIDKGVDTTFLLYKGMGHGPRTPKTLRGVLTHVSQWFDHYLFDAPMPDYVNPEFESSVPAEE
ncbi:S9 family peptidase [Glaciecola sp. XM2]|uniref:S9 family peptidase n=1 Tax=Glaciecola sp. XM2 TaxID=1914931 RepID=UPI001BDF4CF4|nr:S9 family peptidase [Glaciecola sp. XM2]MBT1450359.1 S9 family peptidase [Glaciecola sp. XM2]